MKLVFNVVMLLSVLLFASSCQKDEGIHLKHGYMDKLSYFPGETAQLFFNHSENHANGNISLYSINNRLVATITSDLIKQKVTNQNPWAKGFGYDVTYSYVVPDIKSGVYLWEKKVPMIIKGSNKSEQIVILYPSNTENAYALSGGKSIYGDDKNNFENRATEVSFLRPIELSKYGIEFIKWFDKLNYTNYTYASDYDLEDYSILEHTKLLIIIGHSEYWTRRARQNFDKFISMGGNALVLSGNTMYWQVRYSESGNSMICYKDFTDPVADPLLKTVHWFEESLDYPIVNSVAQDFHLGGGYGLRNDKGWDGYKIVSPDNPIFEGIDVTYGTIIKLPTVEYDGVFSCVFEEDGCPIVDTTVSDFKEVELIGYDFCFSNSIGTFIVARKNADSGTIINTGSTDWCSNNGMGGKDSAKIRALTRNMIDHLLLNKKVFTN